MKNVLFDNFDYQMFWKTVAVIVSSYNFSWQIYSLFRVSMSSLIWFKKKKIQFFYFLVFFNANRFLEEIMEIIGFLKRLWRFAKQTLLKIVIARSPVYFTVLMYRM